MFTSLMPSLNIRSLLFVVFLGGFPSRCQNISSGAIRPGGLLFISHFAISGSNTTSETSPFDIFQTPTCISAQLSPSHTGSYDFLIVRLVAIWSATTDRQCLLRSPFFTIVRSGVFFTICCRSYVNLHDNLCIYTFWPAVGRFIVNN